MDLQSAQSPYTPARGDELPSTNPPVLGPQVPGTSGGLPALSGIHAGSNPMAQQLQSQGRGGDSTLVHMSPDEVNGLQALALMHGTSMTINPETGLPEAFKLGKVFKKLLPTLIGIGMNFILPGSGLAIQGLSTAAQAGLMTGLGSLAITGSLKKGLMAGLGAFGGASLAGGIQGAISGAAAPGATGAATAGTSGVLTNPAAGAINNINSMVANAGLAPGAVSGALPAVPSLAGTIAANAPTSLVSSAVAPAVKTGLAGFSQGFANAAKGPMTGLLGKAAIPLGISGSLQALNAFSPGQKTQGGQIDNSYTGPYTPQARPATYRSESPITSRDSSEQLYFANSMPEIYDMQGRIVQPGTSTAPGTPIFQPVLNPKAKKGQNMYNWEYAPYMQAMPTVDGQGRPLSLQEALAMQSRGFAKGGEIPMDNGAFVMDARSVSEIGNGSSNAGKEILARMGGRPVNGPGDGVSDSVPARIGGTQKARVARDEVIFPAEAVRRIGKGNPQRGTQKLYALMHKAHKARKKAGRGQDTGLRKGLA